MSNLPIRRAQFKTPTFLAWLAEQGAEIGKPTNAYEVVRYKAFTPGAAKAATHIVYAKESGLLTFTGSTREHYEAFLAGGHIGAMAPAGNPPKGWQRPNGEPFNKAGKSVGEVKRQKLLDRDGDECWFCGLAMGEDQTIEHLVPKSAGGRNGLANYALAHGACNRRAANLPLVNKIELRTKMRAKVSA